MRIVQSLRTERSLDEEAWRQFVMQCPQGNVFHTPEMFEVFARTRRHHPTLWATIDDGGSILALLLPVQITLMGGLLHRFTARSVAYGSVLCTPGPEGQDGLELLLRAYTEEGDGGSLFTELRNLSDMEATQPVLQAHGFVYEDHLNYLIDLDRPVEMVFQSIKSRTRKQIRRGLRQGDVEIEEITDKTRIPILYELLQKTYAHAQIPLADRSLFESAFDVLYPKRMIRFTLARIGHAYAGASVELLFKDTVYGWYGAVDREYARYNPSEMLTWHILEWSVQNGYRVYDFGGAGKPDEEYGVRDFKAKFQGELVCYGRNTRVHSKMRSRLSAIGYQLYRRLL